jgi:hypothetical protein
MPAPANRGTSVLTRAHLLDDHALQTRLPVNLANHCSPQLGPVAGAHQVTAPESTSLRHNNSTCEQLAQHMLVQTCPTSSGIGQAPPQHTRQPCVAHAESRERTCSSSGVHDRGSYGQRCSPCGVHQLMPLWTPSPC